MNEFPPLALLKTDPDEWQAEMIRVLASDEPIRIPTKHVWHETTRPDSFFLFKPEGSAAKEKL